MENNQVENNTNFNKQDDSANEQAQIRNKPKLIISSYKIQPKMVEAGKDFDIILTLYNTNAQNAIFNLKVSLDQSSSTEQVSGNNQAGSETAYGNEGSVFTPVERSNTFYRSAIYPWNYSTETIKMNVLPNTKAGNYQMSVNFEYEDYLGNQYQTTESIGIPVVATAAISTSDINIDELFVGEDTNVSMNIYNTGKDNLTNFMCKVEGEGFDVDENSHFIGNFAQGASESFSFNMNPKKEGPLKGKIILTYEDSKGEVHKEEKTFKKQVQMSQNENVDENGNPIESTEQVEQDFNIAPVIGIGSIFLIVLLIYFIRKRSKKKKNKELDLDEN